MSVWDELQRFIYPDIYEDTGKYLRWLKGLDSPTFTGQDVLRIFLNNLDAGEKQYVISFFKEFYTAEILTDGWNLDYTYNYQSSLWDLIFSSWILMQKVTQDILMFFLYRDKTIFESIFEHASEGYRLWSGWMTYYDSVHTEIHRYPSPDTPPWWAY